MTRDDIIRMAREAGLYSGSPRTPSTGRIIEKRLERFAALVRDHLLSTDIHSCHANCERFACVQTRRAVEAEREACAKVAFNAKTYIEAAAAIRARGQA